MSDLRNVQFSGRENGLKEKELGKRNPGWNNAVEAFSVFLQTKKIRLYEQINNTLLNIIY